MPHNALSRRDLLAATAALGATAAAPAQAGGDTSGFVYEIQRTDTEWRAMLSEDEFDIMRNGGTEWPGSSPLWNDYRDGQFSCKGCALTLYTSEWRVPLDKGWVFFAHCQPNAVLTGIDRAANYSMNPDARRTLIEAHCRRCGSHLGHILVVERKLVHCVNGASLVFQPDTA